MALSSKLHPQPRKLLPTVLFVLCLTWDPAAEETVLRPGEIDVTFKANVQGTVLGLHRLNSKIVAIGQDFQRADGMRFGGMLLETNGSSAVYLLLPPRLTSSTIQTGKLVAGGRYPSGVYCLGPDWRGDPTFSGPPFVQGAYGVAAVAGRNDGKVLLLGDVAGAPGRWVNLLNPDGTIDRSWSTPATGGNMLASLPDGGWFIGGAGVLGVQSQSLVRIDHDGSLAPFGRFRFSKLLQFAQTRYYDTGDVNAFDTDGRTYLLVAGGFSQVQDLSSDKMTTRFRVARFSMEGVLDPEFAPVGAPETELFLPPATAVLAQPGGKVLVAFTIARNRSHAVYRYDQTGQIDNSFSPVLLNGAAQAFLRESNGDILVGGGFTTVNGLDFPGVVRIVGDRVVPTITIQTHAAGEFEMKFLITGNVWGTLRIERSRDLKIWEEINVFPGFTGSFNWQTDHPSTGAGFFRASVSQ